LGAASDAARATESQKLLNYGFQFFDAHLLYRAGQLISKQKIYKGKENTIETTVAHDIVITLPKGDYAKINARLVSAKGVVAPIQMGQPLGKIQFLLDGKVIDERQLVAKNAMPLAGIFGRAMDSIPLLFH
jgi:D-alanyl-D-alanine carboxypeptidase (penicillin-binding protein 5/6)